MSENVADVNIIATDSRSMTEEEAYKTHRRLADAILAKNENQTLFKKCDSTLRGHILTEFKALLEVTGKNSVLLQPANPAANRCIRNGAYFVNDKLLEDTGFAVDPDFPSSSSLVKNLLLERASRHSKMDKIHTGIITEINSEGIFVPDCNTIEDLKKCVELYNEQTILGGSAAFFEQFQLKHYPNLSEVKPNKYNFSDHYLLLSGSTQPESIRFATKLKNENCPVLILPDTLLEKNIDEVLLINWIEKTVQVYAENQKLVLRISNKIIQFEDSSKILKNRMNIVVQQLLERSTINELFIEGGATAFDVLQKLNWKAFTPIAELAPGVVRMQYNLDAKKFITIKPGSYQWPEGLLE
jgi:uncharacterized protein YgbK (DUF1537 family)